jgi:hypothetical protein
MATPPIFVAEKNVFQGPRTKSTTVTTDSNENPDLNLFFLVSFVAVV